MAEIKEFKCPSCGGAVTFDTATQKMKCPYCGTEFNIEDLKKYNEQLNETKEADTKWESEAGQEWQPGETEGMRIYTCNSCGGEIVADSTTAASSCPFCGNPVVMTGQLEGGLKPDLIIPFRKDKKAAKEALLEHYKGKRLLPKVFVDENHLDEIKGVYVPFWIFDTDVDADIRYKATRTRTWSDSKYNYTETSYYSVLRSGDIGFNNIPADASTKVANDLMESIEPFDISQAVDFETGYLSGYFADRYDVKAEEQKNRINGRVQQSTEDSFRATVTGYNTVTTEQANLRYSHAKARYALYPVWLLTTTWQDQNYLFAVNGQTGKIVGNLPLDKGAYAKWLGIITVIAAVVIYLILWLLSMM